MDQYLEQQLHSDLCRIISGRAVSLVGNAASLLSSKYGKQIDEGCVVRLNSGVPIHPVAQGRRIDIHCFTTRSSLMENLKRSTWKVRLKRRFFDEAFSVWMSGEERDTCQNSSQAFYPLRFLDDLTQRLGAKPSVGARALHMLTELTDAEIRMFGFDFKETSSFYRRKENPGPHNWAGEREIVLDLARKGRLALMC